MGRISKFACIFACLVMAACQPNGSYVVLVTATPSTGLAETNGRLAPLRAEAGTPLPSAQPSPTFIPTPDATRTDIVDPTQNQSYLVQPGDTLTIIALRFGVTVEAITKANRLADTDTLAVGQVLILPTAIQAVGPAVKIIPDSEFVYGPGVREFSVERFLSNQDCFLCSYSEEIDGRRWSGIEIVNRVAVEQSINPRLLLAVLEYSGHWISQKTVSDDSAAYPLGYLQRPTEIYGLYRQLDWAGKIMSTGYYGWRQRGLSATLLVDGTRVGLNPALNAGTAALEVLLSQTRSLSGWLTAVGYTGLLSTYVSMFGDPFQYAVEPLIPPDLTQPPMQLPWLTGESWYFTGGPHGGWGSGSAWAAVDFVPPQQVQGCEESKDWVRAVADGVIAVSSYGIVILDLDGDGFLGTGWTVVYLHTSTATRAVTVGQRVRAGDPIGHPACEGGVSQATHLHIARRYNGEWIAADCSNCMLTVPQPQWDIDGWIAHSFGREYDGSFTRGDQYREACTCRDPINTMQATGP